MFLSGVNIIIYLLISLTSPRKNIGTFLNQRGAPVENKRNCMQPITLMSRCSICFISQVQITQLLQHASSVQLDLTDLSRPMYGTISFGGALQGHTSTSNRTMYNY